MTKLDWYIVKRFLSTFFYVLILIMCISVVFDISEKLDEFMTNKVPIKEIIFDYYVNFVLYYANLFSALVIFLAVLLFTAKMARDTEIVPILSAGVSFTRFLVPYFIGATVLVLISLGANHFLIPNANKKRILFEDKYDNQNFNIKDAYKQTEAGSMVYFKTYIGEEGQIYDFWISNRDVSTGKLKSILHADVARGDSSSNKWHLNNMFIREFGNDSLSHKFKRTPIADTTFNFSLNEFTATAGIASTMPTPKLVDFINDQTEKGSTEVAAYKVELHQRTSYPLATYILTLLGVCIASRKSRDSIGMNMAIGLLLALLYLFCIKMTTVAALKVGFSPFWAVWTPNIIFIFISYFVYLRTPK